MFFLASRALRALPRALVAILAAGPIGFKRRGAIKNRIIGTLAVLMFGAMTFAVLVQGAAGRFERPLDLWFTLVQVIVAWALLGLVYVWLATWLKTKRWNLIQSWKAHGQQRRRARLHNEDPYLVRSASDAGLDERAGAHDVHVITTLGTDEAARAARKAARHDHLDVTNAFGETKSFFDEVTGYAPSRFPNSYEQTIAMLNAAKAARAGQIKGGSILP